MSPLCLRLASLADTLVDGARLSAVTCRASGEFALEGAAAVPGPLPDLAALLQGLPSRVTLSWRGAAARSPQAGQRQAFALQGQFDHGSSRETEALPASDAEALLARVTSWARESGLEHVSVSRAPDEGLDSLRLHWRQKVLGLGTYGQIRSFLEHLRGMGPSSCLGELAIVPVPQEVGCSPRARLYAAVDLVVRHP